MSFLKMNFSFKNAILVRSEFQWAIWWWSYISNFTYKALFSYISSIFIQNVVYIKKYTYELDNEYTTRVLLKSIKHRVLI